MRNVFTKQAVQITPQSPLVAIISAENGMVVFQSIEDNQLALYSHDLASSRTTKLLAGPSDGTPWFGPSIRDDGAQLVALDRDSPTSPRQWLVLVNTDGSGHRRLARLEEGFREAVISGDGRIVFAVSEWNRVVRVEVESGETREIIAPSPHIDRIDGAARPGAENRVVGAGFAESVQAPELFPSLRIGGFSVELDGRPMPLLGVSPTEAVYQIPWEMPVGAAARNVVVKLPAGDRSPFEGPQAQVTLPGPAAMDPWVYREDGSRVGTTFDLRLRTGEIVDAYATGFQVAGLPTGIPSSDWPAPLDEPVACEFSRWDAPVVRLEWVPADVLWFREAPRRAGAFQIRVRVPDGVPGFARLQSGVRSADTYLRCSHRGSQAMTARIPQ
jgi:uncharacterized protein (TIGR03437 family)